MDKMVSIPNKEVLNQYMKAVILAGGRGTRGRDRVRGQPAGIAGTLRRQAQGLTAASGL